MDCINLTLKTIKNVELRRKTFKTTQKYESHQITMNCIDLTSKRSKTVTSQTFKTQNYKSDQIIMNCIDLMSKTSHQRKTTKVILFRCICIDLTSKRSKNAKLAHKQSNNDQFPSIWVKTIKNFELRRKTFKTTQNYESDQIIMNCIDLTSKRSKCWVTS